MRTSAGFRQDPLLLNLFIKPPKHAVERFAVCQINLSQEISSNCKVSCLSIEDSMVIIELSSNTVK